MRCLGLLLALGVACVPRGLVEAAKDRDRDGFVASQLGGDDCDDAAPAVNPDADEVCGNAVDDDCDGDVDEDGLGATTWYEDVDRDGYGGDEARSACEAPPGFVAVPGDCDDLVTAVSPAANEVCGNAVDDDCDGATDDTGVGATTWYRDGDDDGHGDLADAVVACEAPDGFVATADDCDDTTSAVRPGLAETCNNGIDDNCDGSAIPCELRGVIGLGTADVKLRGIRVGHRFGGAVAAAHLDDNQWADLLVGAGYWALNASTQAELYALAAPLDVPGGIASSSLPPPVNVPVEDGPSEFAAEVLACDIDNDGLDEVFTPWIEGAWSSPFPQTVATRFVRMEANDVLSGLLPPAAEITAVTGIAPFPLVRPLCADFDTSPTVVLQEASSTPRIVAFWDLGGAGRGPDDADWQVVPAAGGTPIPLAYEDLDGDGVGDLVVGHPATDTIHVIADDRGGVISESAAWLSFGLPGAGGHAAVVDVDGDQTADVLILADVEGGNAIFAFRGPFVPGTLLGSEHAAFSMYSRPGSPLHAIGTVGDLDGDGHEDWCARSHTDDRGDVDAGAVYCWYGGLARTGVTSVEGADVWFVGEGANDGVAATFGTYGDRPRMTHLDVNRDGRDDLVIGAPFTDVGALTDAGTVYVFWGTGL